jgi:hypothetical protein
VIPNYYACNSCGEKFKFNSQAPFYHPGSEPLGLTVDESVVLDIPVRPAWCKDCDGLCRVEDILPAREIENACAAVRSGRHVEYPVNTEFMEPDQAQALVGAYLRWRMKRRRPARALCCGGVNFQFMDVAQPLIKHAECEFGFITGWYTINPCCGVGPGVYSAASIPLHDTEGELIGRLTWRQPGASVWQVEPAGYPPGVMEI